MNWEIQMCQLNENQYIVQLAQKTKKGAGLTPLCIWFHKPYFPVALALV